jgi:hypothetical protein
VPSFYDSRTAEVYALTTRAVPSPVAHGFRGRGLACGSGCGETASGRAYFVMELVKGVPITFPSFASRFSAIAYVNRHLDFGNTVPVTFGGGVATVPVAADLAHPTLPHALR